MYRHGLETHANTKVLLGEPSMYRHGLGTWTERLSTSHMDDMMNHIEMLAIAATPPHVMIGRGVVNLVRVITKDDSRDVVFEWELDELILS